MDTNWKQLTIDLVDLFISGMQEIPMDDSAIIEELLSIFSKRHLDELGFGGFIKDYFNKKFGDDIEMYICPSCKTQLGGYGCEDNCGVNWQDFKHCPWCGRKLKCGESQAPNVQSVKINSAPRKCGDAPKQYNDFVFVKNQIKLPNKNQIYPQVEFWQTQQKYEIYWVLEQFEYTENGVDMFSVFDGFYLLEDAIDIGLQLNDRNRDKLRDKILNKI